MNHCHFKQLRFFKSLSSTTTYKVCESIGWSHDPKPKKYRPIASLEGNHSSHSLTAKCLKNRHQTLLEGPMLRSSGTACVSAVSTFLCASLHSSIHRPASLQRPAKIEYSPNMHRDSNMAPRNRTPKKDQKVQEHDLRTHARTALIEQLIDTIARAG